MRKNVFVFDDKLSSDTVGNLIYNIDKSEPLESEDKSILIYFSTDGGFVYSAHILADYLKRLAEYGINIEIVITESCHSAGLFFLMYLQIVTKNCKGLVNYSFFQYSEAILHEISVNLQTRDDRSLLSVYMGQMEIRKNNILKFFKKNLTKSEIADFMKGGDVFLNSDRLCKIFGAKEINIF